MLMATCCEDDVVPHVLPFVQKHIRDQDWRYRDAAVMAFGKFYRNVKSRYMFLVRALSNDQLRLETLKYTTLLVIFPF